jgi:hypothetical protein
VGYGNYEKNKFWKSLFSSESVAILSRFQNIEDRTYIIFGVVLYGCETRSPTFRKEDTDKLKVSEGEVFRTLPGPEKAHTARNLQCYKLLTRIVYTDIEG